MINNQNSVYIQDISDIYTVNSAMMGDKPAMGFTITYSNGVFENIIESKDDYESTLCLITQTRGNMLSLLQGRASI
ncbi:MAG: hypothetical protein CVU50_06095 [Candidatus Cloacimonetes bacterium HGW-Cloacimonetes-3]|jgi:hypothetical protein|nr:MAG: hypothetical protein CVU50_06095 [Candidatus Cloacimonetes bacterium HGW-Cloacimonetes-3]